MSKLEAVLLSGFISFFLGAFVLASINRQHINYKQDISQKHYFICVEKVSSLVDDMTCTAIMNQFVTIIDKDTLDVSNIQNDKTCTEIFKE